MALLEKDSYIPYYVQIRTVLLDRIRSGLYIPGEWLPSEQTLADEFGVTRVTVRKALQELKQEGAIRTEKGKGSIVCESAVEQSLHQFYSFGREIGNTGEAAGSRIIRIRRKTFPRRFKRSLGKQCDEPVHEIVRLRYYRGGPFILEFSYVPLKVAPTIVEKDLEGYSIYDLLEHNYGHRIQKAKEYLYPRTSDAYESRLLGIPMHSPVFQTERVTRGEDDLILEFRRSVIRGDKVTFSTELV